MTNITHLHHASLLVGNLQTSRKFYEGILGLLPSDKRPKLAVDGVWYELGNAQIHLIHTAHASSQSSSELHAGRDKHIALRVVDIAALKLALEAAAIPFTMSRSGRRALFCRDPDGNGLEFVES